MQGGPEVGATAWSREDRECMALALQAARRAAGLGEIPVGAVLVLDGHVLAVMHNLRETAGDPTAHAEMLAVRAGGRSRLDGATLYATLEPCPMCAGALWLARVARLVYAAADPRAGAAGSVYNVVADARLNHRLAVDAGLMAGESADLLRAFFRDLRSGPKSGAGCGGAATEGCPSG